MLYYQIKPIVRLQISYALLASLWNIISVVLISYKTPPLGPTHSPTLAVTLIAISIALYLGAKHCLWLYAGLSLLIVIANCMAIPPVFLHDPGLWLNDTSRYASALLNGSGLLLSAYGVFFCLRNSPLLSRYPQD